MSPNGHGARRTRCVGAISPVSETRCTKPQLAAQTRRDGRNFSGRSPQLREFGPSLLK